MKVYFTASTAEFNKYKHLYFQIRDFLVDQNHVLTRDWLDETRLRIDRGVDVVTDIKEIYRGCMQAISDADLVIVEDTVSNFSTGHQITVALQRQKPTLVLWSKPKHRHFKNSFINGIDSDILEPHEYSSTQTLKQIIGKFVNKYQNSNQRNRFNLVLTDLERRYLDWAQYHKNTSRTKIIRKSLKEQIENDSDFQNYLSGL